MAYDAPSKTTVSASGSVAEGAKYVAIVTSDDFVGTILGDTASPSTSYPFHASAGNRLQAIAYTIDAGSVEIIKVV